MRQGGLARTSNTPGRTQELNFFQAADVPLYLVDMPGYGFAKAPKEKVAAWTALVSDYLRGRVTLARVFLLIDARHGLKPPDLEVMKMLDTAAVSYQVVLTKADKIGAHELEKVVEATTAGTEDARGRLSGRDRHFVGEGPRRRRPARSDCRHRGRAQLAPRGASLVDEVREDLPAGVEARPRRTSLSGRRLQRRRPSRSRVRRSARSWSSRAR